MGGDWRHGVAGLAAGFLTMLFVVFAFLLGFGQWLVAALEAAARLGDVVLLPAVVLVGIAIVVGPGALWYGLACLLLRFLGAADR